MKSAMDVKTVKTVVIVSFVQAVKNVMFVNGVLDVEKQVVKSLWLMVINVKQKMNFCKL